MKKNNVTLHFHDGKLKFSIGHFTIFSKTERETLHGHNYTLHVKVETEINEPGITFDYRLFEEKLVAMCKKLNWYFLIPERSPYLSIVDDDPHYQITFDNESMWLLKKDVVLMPLENITLETLSQWFVDEVTADTVFMQQFHVKKINVTVFNGPAHAAESCCSK